LMNWAQGLLDDENVFPHKIGKFRLLARELHAPLSVGALCWASACIAAPVDIFFQSMSP
jgi:hypothetical protein